MQAHNTSKRDSPVVKIKSAHRKMANYINTYIYTYLHIWNWIFLQLRYRPSLVFMYVLEFKMHLETLFITNKKKYTCRFTVDSSTMRSWLAHLWIIKLSLQNFLEHLIAFLANTTRDPFILLLFGNKCFE